MVKNAAMMSADFNFRAFRYIKIPTIKIGVTMKYPKILMVKI